MKNLPIQLVEFRGQQDEFLAEGMGSDALCKWITEDLCFSQCDAVFNQFEEWKPIFDERERLGNYAPMLFEVQLHQKAEAKSYRKDIGSILNFRHSPNIVGMSGRRKMLVKVNNKDALIRLSNRFKRQPDVKINNKVLRAYAAIESVNLFRPSMDEDLLNKALKIRLVDYCDEYLNRSCEERLRMACEEFEQSCSRINYCDGVSIYETYGTSQEMISRIATLDGILSIQMMPYMSIDVLDAEIDDELRPKTPETDVTYPLVGIVDTGIQKIPPISPWINGETQCPKWDEEDISKDHGTMVASIILYGDDLCGEKRTGAEPCIIRDCVVHSRNLQVSEAECLYLIEKAISANPDVKVWNSSMGSNRDAPYDCISEYAMALDRLQKEHNIVICKSAGNKNGESNRISCGADSLRSLVVGSTTYEYNQEGKCVENWSPTSRIGLAAGAVIKPDLANLGGDTGSMIKLLSKDNRIVKNCGTSFSTPRIAAMAANIAKQLGNNYDPTLVKALLISNTYYPEGIENEEAEDKVAKLGFGVPLPIDSILYNDENEITMIFPCQFLKGHNFQVTKFIFPECLVENEVYYGDITITIAADPILNPKQATEYCQTDVEVALCTYEREKTVNLADPATPRIYRNRVRLENSKNVLVENCYKHGNNLEQDSGLWEYNQIDKSHKFSPIKKYHIDLSKMKETDKTKFLNKNRQWALKLSSIFREETIQSLESEELTFKAFVVMTIRDTKKKGLLYNQAIQQLSARNFHHQSINVQQNLFVESEN